MSLQVKSAGLLGLVPFFRLVLLQVKSAGLLGLVPLPACFCSKRLLSSAPSFAPVPRFRPFPFLSCLLSFPFPSLSLSFPFLPFPTFPLSFPIFHLFLSPAPFLALLRSYFALSSTSPSQHFFRFPSRFSRAPAQPFNATALPVCRRSFQSARGAPNVAAQL